MDNTNIKDNAVNAESPNIGKKINPIPKPSTNIGIDIDDEFYEVLTNAGVANVIDITQFNNFSQLSQNRETLYHVLDTMAEDSTVAAMLETYAEDATETNDQGKIVWAESSDAEVAKYIEFLLNSLNVNKNIYNWVHSLVKYGDLYLRLFRQSDFEDDLLMEKDKTPLNEKFSNINSDVEPLNENVFIKAYEKSDKLVNYIEAVPNPGEMFELTKFGKSYAYIKTNITPTPMNKNQTLASSYYTYRFRRNDVQVFNAVGFVHASLQDDTPRLPEKVQLFRNDDELENPDDTSYTYSVRRGQSLLYNMYKVWRQMMLLENALLLNRLTKSSILRVIEVEVADMPKERVGPHLQRIKSLVEQKTSITDGNSMSEYTNPGAMENNIYVPTHNGVGAINTQQIGGDVNVRDIADIDYFKNKFYAASKIPKQFMGDTDDATGFNGGTSLSIVSSRYAKTIKRIQATMCQALTDAINILLIDRGLDNYVNKFSIRMQSPVTQEELDKRDNTSSKIQISDDVMRMVDGIEDEIIKLKILKALLSNAITNTEVIDLIQEQIDALELAQEEESLQEEDNSGSDFGDDESFDFGDFGGGTSDNDLGGFDDNLDLGGDEEVGPEAEEDTGEDTLPTPADLDAGDFSEMI